MSDTVITTLTFTTLGSILFLLVGFVVGWLAKEHVYKTTPWHPDNLHPEMIDEHGNIIPDDILALRFENADNFSSDQPGTGEGWSNPSEWPEEEDD